MLVPNGPKERIEYVNTELLEGTGEDPYRFADQAQEAGVELPEDYEAPDSTMIANLLR